MQTRRSILKNRQGSGDVISLSSSSSEGEPHASRPQQVRKESSFLGKLQHRLQTRFPTEDDNSSDSTSSQILSPNELNDELYRLKYQNLQLKKGRGSPIRGDTGPCPSVESFCSEVSEAVRSVKSYPQRSAQAATRPSTSTIQSPNPSRPLNTLYLLPKHHRLNILETLVRAFPVTIPTEEFAKFVDSKGHPDLTVEMKRYFKERKDQHKVETERYINVFKSEKPWEPKWFTNAFWQLLVSTKARPNVYQYMFNIREREEESNALKKWWQLSKKVKWIISATSFLTYFCLLCVLVEFYGDEGINLAVPVTLFATIVLNKVLVNMNSALPNGM